MFLRITKKTDLNERADEDILHRFAASGDGRLIGELFTRYTHLLFGVAFNIMKDEDEAKDAVMKVFEKLITRATFEDIRSFKSWICVVTKNQCLMEIRHRNAENRAISVSPLALEREILEFSNNLSPDSPYSSQEVTDRLPECIARLNEEQKICIELFFLEEKSYEEIARLTGYGLNYVKSYIQNGKRNLKKMLEYARTTK